jgi:hypothetical protein
LIIYIFSYSMSQGVVVLSFCCFHSFIFIIFMRSISTDMIGLYLKELFLLLTCNISSKRLWKRGRRCHLILCLAFKESHIKSETHVLLFPPMSRLCDKISVSTILGPYVYHGEHMSTRYELSDLVLIFLVYWPTCIYKAFPINYLQNCLRYWS